MVVFSMNLSLKPEWSRKLQGERTACHYHVTENGVLLQCEEDSDPDDVWPLTESAPVLGSRESVDHISTVSAISPDDSLLATAAGSAFILIDRRTHETLYRSTMPDIIVSLRFSDTMYWLYFETPDKVITWDLESKNIIDREDTSPCARERSRSV